MKNLVLSSLSLGAWIVGNVANAADMPVNAPPPPPSACVTNDIVRADNQVSVDFIATYIDYLEFAPSTGAPFDSEKGWVPGASVTASLMTNFANICNIYLWTRFSVINGHTQYWASGGAATSNTDGAREGDWDFRFGKGFNVGENAMLTPYVGAGVRLWNRLLVGPGGYNEAYQHAYAGGGLLLQYSPAPYWFSRQMG